MELKKSDDNMIDQEIQETGLTFLNYNGGDFSDGGYRDVCKSLLNQIKQVEKMYKDQLTGLKQRKQDLKDAIVYDIKAVIICVFIVFCLIGFVKFCEYVMIDGVLLVLYGFIKIGFPAFALALLFFIMPTYLRRLYVNIRNYHVMNETFADEKVGDDIVTFLQEERFLKDKLFDIKAVKDDHKRVEAEHAGRYDEEWDDSMQSDVDRLRKASVFREYYAHGIRKESAIKQAFIPYMLILFITIAAVLVHVLLNVK